MAAMTSHENDVLKWKRDAYFCHKYYKLPALGAQRKLEIVAEKRLENVAEKRLENVLMYVLLKMGEFVVCAQEHDRENIFIKNDKMHSTNNWIYWGAMDTRNMII